MNFTEMKNGNFFEDLKKYFKSNSREEILKDWESSEEFDKVGPSAEEFFQNSHRYQKVVLKTPFDLGINFNQPNINPKYTSDFLFYHNNNSNAKSSVFN